MDNTKFDEYLQDLMAGDNDAVFVARKALIAEHNNLNQKLNDARKTIGFHENEITLANQKIDRLTAELAAATDKLTHARDQLIWIRDHGRLCPCCNTRQPHAVNKFGRDYHAIGCSLCDTIDYTTPTEEWAK